MNPISFSSSAIWNRIGVVRSVVVGMLAGVLFLPAFSGCTKNSSPASSHANAPATPTPPPPPPPPPDPATAGLPQMLPDAETGIPAWAGQPNEPFPVRQFLESRAIPANNAAPLYFAALAEIAPQLYLSSPPAGWPWDHNKISERVAHLGDAVGNLCNQDKLIEGSVSEEDVKTLLTEAQTAIKKLDEAQQRPRCVFVAGMRFDSILPHIQATRAFARLAAIQLYYARLKKSFDEAETPIQRLLRLSRDIRPRGCFVTQLVSYTLDGIILGGIADFTLGQPELKAKDCDRLLALLVEHEREAVSSAEEGLRVEYVTLRNTLDALQQGRISAKSFAQLMTVGSGESQAAGLEQRLAQANWQAEIAACNTAFADALALAAVPYDRAQTNGWSEKEISKIKSQNVFLTPMLFSNVESILEGIQRGRAQLAGVQCLTAVRRYALTHNTLPESLEVAVREAGLQAVPVDPYSGGPMHYKVIDGKPVVYSIGPDRKDDGGEKDWDNGQWKGDFIYRIRE
jgi:hypothetical protein